ncbi:MAG: 23S rRNA (adenine(2503)-C(2))-methyltransferase RlmN [Bacteroidetes bacterium]|nr:MAG: 23S rRNA (adenine(2503)-C(2))-methyltransferase RlmN [Bacteroidota bacterium]
MFNSSPKKDIRTASEQELTTLIQELNQPKFRIRQIKDWVWKHQVSDFKEMRNIPNKLIEVLSNNYQLHNIRVAYKAESKDGTVKLAFRLYDGFLIEGVLIPTQKRMTACISSQVGCGLTCKFCATGKLKRERNLLPFEIYQQAFIINQIALEKYQKPLTNIVMMGMGEPLLNYKNVLEAIDHMTNPDYLGISPKKITLSTAGIAKMIRKLAEDQPKINFALSLHAANDEKRNKIMPINEQNNLRELIKALKYYHGKTGNKITFEYILFNNFNDSKQDADELIKTCKQVPQSKVNLIEFNSVEGSNFSKSLNADWFCKYLNQNGVLAKIRKSRGEDIDAACGQLANKIKPK